MLGRNQSGLSCASCTKYAPSKCINFFSRGQHLKEANLLKQARMMKARQDASELFCGPPASLR
eukprot:1228528-Amphidinium_carterae.2